MTQSSRFAFLSAYVISITHCVLKVSIRIYRMLFGIILARFGPFACSSFYLSPFHGGPPNSRSQGFCFMAFHFFISPLQSVCQDLSCDLGILYPFLNGRISFQNRKRNPVILRSIT